MRERLHYGGRPMLRLDGRSAGAGRVGRSAVMDSLMFAQMVREDAGRPVTGP